MTTRRRLLAAATAATALPLAAPALSQGASAAARTLRFVPQADLSILDPHWNTAYVTRNHAFMVYDTLYGLDASGTPRPQMLAGDEVSGDGRRRALTLREGLRFHDGAPVLARDCVASVRRWASRDGFGVALMAATDELSAPDDRTIVFRLKRPFPLLPAALGKSGVYAPAIMPERLAAAPGADAAQVTEITGSGPFRFVAAERVPGARAVYERNRGYVPRPGGEAPSGTAGPKVVHLDRVEWVTTPDPATAAAALQNGEVDWWEFANPDLLALLRRNRDVAVSVQDPTGFVGAFRMNHLQPPFDNPAVRRAVLRAVDQRDFMTAAAGDDPAMWRVPSGVFTPGTPLASDAGLEAFTAPRDLDRARRELAAAGYDGAPVVLLVATDFPHLRAMSEVGADLMRRIGMRVDDQALDWGTVLTRRANRGAPAQGGWSGFFTFAGGVDTATPAGHTMLRANGGAGWFGWPDDPRIEELRAAWFEAPDEAAQKSVAADLQRRALESVPFVPLGQYFQATAHRRSLAGVLPGFATFWNLRKEA